MDFQQLNKEIRPLDQQSMKEAKERWDYTAKPVGSLGILEDIIIRLAGISGKAYPAIDKRAVIVLCADNGVLAQGVAMTPPEITAVMTGFIAQHRSAVCIMAKQSNTDIITVDMGMFSRVKKIRAAKRCMNQKYLVMEAPAKLSISLIILTAESRMG